MSCRCIAILVKLTAFAICDSDAGAGGNCLRSRCAGVIASYENWFRILFCMNRQIASRFWPLAVTLVNTSIKSRELRYFAGRSSKMSAAIAHLHGSLLGAEQ